MDVRLIADTGMETPPLVLGGNVFGWTATGEEAFAILDRFVDAGGRMIDTADVYSNWVDGHEGGESETLIGAWLKRRGSRDDILIATKVGMLAGEGGAKLEPARIGAACDASLKRLGTDHIDLYYAHQDDSDTPLADSLAAFDRLVRAGKVRALGASNYDADRLRAALDISRREGLAAYRALQPEYNLVRREAYEGPLAEAAAEGGLAVFPYFGLASGFLTGKYRSEADFGKSVRGGRMAQYLDARGMRVLAALDAVAAAHDTSPAAVALAWLARQPTITAPIASARTRTQLETLLASMTLDLLTADLAALDAASA